MKKVIFFLSKIADQCNKRSLNLFIRILKKKVNIGKTSNGRSYGLIGVIILTPEILGKVIWPTTQLN